MSDKTPPRPVRLSISHLLLWTTTTALVVALLQGVMPLQESAGSPWRRTEWIVTVVLLCCAPAWGAAIAGGVLAVWRLIHYRAGFPAEPGHWMLVILGTFAVGAGLVILLENVRGPAAFAVVVLLGLAVLIPIETGFAAWCSNSRHWQFAFLSIVIGLLGISFHILVAAVGSHSRPAPSLVVLGLLGICVAIGLPPLAFVVAVLTDLVRRERRDALHWIGIAALAAITAQPIAIFAIEAVVQRMR